MLKEPRGERKRGLNHRHRLKINREWRATSDGGSKIRSQVKRLKHLGARRGTAGCLCRKPVRTQGSGLSTRDDDDDVYYYIRWRLKLEGETENMGVCPKERKVMMMMMFITIFAGD